MKIKNFFCLFWVCIAAFRLLFSARGNDGIQIPKTGMRDALLYLANDLGMNIILTNTDGQYSNSFSSTSTDTKEIIEQFKEKNKDMLDIWYEPERKTIICVDKRTSKLFQELMGSIIFHDKNGNMYVKVAGTKKRFEFSCSPLEREKYLAFVKDKGKSSPKEISVKQLIYSVIDSESELLECYIPFTIGTTKAQIADEKRLADELQTKIEAIEQGADKASKEELNSLKNWLARMRTSPSYEQSYYSASISPQETDEWREPTYEQIAQIMKMKSKKSISKEMMSEAPYRNVNFFIQKAVEYDAVRFLSALFKQKVFDIEPISGGIANISLIGSEEIPGQIAKTNNYEAIQYFLKNIDKMSPKFQKTVIGSFRKIDRTRLDKECLDIFLTKAKEFKIESIYVDTSKWIGDDLPDDYDRWKDFKVSETKIAFERDKTIGQSKYHLVFYKYASPVKIGGIPLKTFEQADYSTPEKACVSADSARTYEWRKTSYYGKYLKEYYSPLDNWKSWHSGLEHFAEILYKVEVSDGMAKVPEKPQLFLVKKLLDNEGEIVAVPMTFENGNWKFMLRWTVHIDILSEYIEEEIAKSDPSIKKR